MWKTVHSSGLRGGRRQLKGTNNKLLSKVLQDLRLLREFGLKLLEEDRVKKLSSDVYELRTRQGSNINRVLFGVRGDRVFVLVTSFVKKSNRTPKSMIRVAEERLAQWGKRDEELEDARSIRA
jgi:phage-related protein